MKKPTRAEVFAQASKRIRQEFQELQVVPHSGVKGGEAENILKQFLNQHLPKRFAAGSGFIIDHNDNLTGHNDVIVYDALNCPLYRAAESAAIIPNDNVAAVIEVKSSLDKYSLESAADKIKEAKTLAKTRPAPLAANTSQLQNFETIGIVFAYESPLNFSKLADHYSDAIRATGLGPHIDYVFLLDKGMLTLGTHPPRSGGWTAAVWYGTPPIEGFHIATAAFDLGVDTIDAFVRALLMHLQFFRHMVDHPGFNWSSESTGRKVRTSYLTSVTNESDPVKREAMLAIYREEASRLMMRGD
jgi:uncharacterized protein DUF6602